MKVALCTPSLNGLVQDEYAKSFGQLCRRQADITLMHIPCRGVTLVHEARNFLVAQALNSGADKVFFVDADMSFRPDDFIRLATSPHPLIGGIYQQRARQWNAPLSMVARYSKFPPVVDDDGVIRMDGLGTGFLCIAREVFDAVRESGRAPKYLPKAEAVVAGPAETVWNHYRAYFDFSWMAVSKGLLPAECRAVLDRIGYEYEADADGEFARLMVGEDFTFCNKARDCGFELVADPDCRLVHWDGTVAHPMAFRDIKWDAADSGKVQILMGAE